MGRSAKSHQDYKNLARTCRDVVRKAEDKLELQLDKYVKNDKKGFFRYLSSKQKHREDVHRPVTQQGREEGY